MKALIIFPMLILAFSCKQEHKKPAIIIQEKSEPTTTSEKDEQARKENQIQIDAAEVFDSLVLKEALDYAYHNSGKNSFLKKYNTVSPDSSFQVEVEINLGMHFTKDQPHLIIHRKYTGEYKINIYSKNENEFKEVLFHTEGWITYTSDTIRDINGDGYKDFIVNWYGSSGCCLKAFSEVYLLKPDKKTFFENKTFINPTFSPKEKIIRGVEYGFAGETDMYKYKWNGEQVDTIEFVSYEKDKKNNKTGKIIVSNDQSEILRRLDDVPTEYKNIAGFDWFTGEGYQ